MSSLISLQSKLTEIASKYPHKTAIRFSSQDTFKDYTYSDLVQESKKIGAWLVNQLIQKGARAAIILDNCPQWLMSYFGVMFAGLTAVPLDPQVSAGEMCTLLNDANAEIVFSSKNKINLLKEINSKINLKKIVLVDSGADIEEFAGFYNIQMTDSANTSWPKVEASDIASIIYTSGTVAKPKGVMLTHQNFLSNFNSCYKLKIYSQRDCFISILPLFHAYAFMGTVLIPLFSGATISYPLSLKGADLQDCMQKTGVSIVIGVPQIFYNIHKAIFDNINKISFSKRVMLSALLNMLWNIRKLTGINLAKMFLSSVHHKFGPRLRFLASGGARLDVKVCEDLLKLGFTILEGYGLTEVSPVAAFNLPRRYKIGSIGKAIPGVSIKIINPDKDGQGEIAIKGDNVMQGYFNRPDETAQVFKDGWFLTGDLGLIDKQGFIFITGRAKEVIVLSSGKNIYPEEVEAYYQKAVGVKELCVLEVRDARGLDSLQAVVVPDFAYFKKAEGGNIYGKIKGEFENISHNLATYKRISGFILTKDELARTRLGKIKRYEVEEKHLRELISKEKSRSQIAQELSSEDLRLINSSLGKKVIEYVKNALALKDDPNLDDHLELDLGVDSLARVELIAGLEKLFGVTISESEAQEVTNIRQMILKLGELIIKDSKESKADDKELSWDILRSIDLPQEIKNKIILKPSLFNKIFTLVITKLFLVLFKIVWNIKVEGRENIPRKGAFILYANHTSYLDGVAVAVAVPYLTELNLYFIGWKQIFEHPTLKWTNKIARLVPIDSSAELMSSMQIAAFLLKNKKSICIYPEGQRSFDGKILPFKKGVGILVKELDCVVVPTLIEGAFQAWPRVQKFPRPHPIKVKFGPPINYAELQRILSGKNQEISYERIAAILREELIKLYNQ